MRFFAKKILLACFVLAQCGVIAEQVCSADSMTPVETQAAIARVATLIEENYFDVAKATEIAATIRAASSDPTLAGLTDPGILASELTARLQPYDLHFAISWRDPAAQGSGPTAGRSLPVSDPFDYDQRRNFGFIKVDRLAGNIGYLNLKMFAPIDASDPTDDVRTIAQAAMTLLAARDAVIIDVRENGGGDPAMVQFLMSHFFDDTPLHYATFFSRAGNVATEMKTLKSLPSPRMTNTPLFILTSGRTGSAAEAFAYHLQALGRATIVGERTVGAANQFDDFEFGNGFFIQIPFYSVSNTVTNSNWEGTGVIPDVAVPASLALEKAEGLALSAALARNLRDGDRLEGLWLLEVKTAIDAGIMLSPAQAQDYVGNYGGQAGRVISWQNSALFYRRGSRQPIKLQPLSEKDSFGAVGNPDLKFYFERDGEGDVSDLVVLQSNGQVSAYNKSGN